MRTANNYFRNDAGKFITTAKETLKRLDGEICAFLALYKIYFVKLDVRNKGVKKAERYSLSRKFKTKYGWYVRTREESNETELESQYPIYHSIIENEYMAIYGVTIYELNWRTNFQN